MPARGVPPFWARAVGRMVLAVSARCPVCGGLLAPGETDGPCPACALTLAPRLGGYCPACGNMAEDPDTPPALCPDCRAQPGPLGRVVFHGRYEGVLRELILDFKFGGGLPRARLLGRFLAEAWRRGGVEDPDRLLVPVSLHPRRLAWRGFNQSLELAREAGKHLRLAVAAEAMTRVRHTTPQSELPGNRRRENIQGAFAADPGLVVARDVILVDDVMTTGATVEAAARALLGAGASRVDVLVVGR